MSRVRRLLLAVTAVVAIAAVAFFTTLASLVDRQLNRVVPDRAARPTPAAESLHRGLRVADLHADALLWPRDLLQRANHGHVDLPRLQDGGVALQVFSVVTKTPRGINYERNSAATDNITLLAIAERYPLRAWRSLFERALYQAAKLRDAERRSRGQLVVLTSKASLDAFLAARQGGARPVGGILATEGLHPLEGRLDRLDSLVAVGYRIFGLTHFFDNEIGGSAHGERRGGLTRFGRAVIARLDSLSLIIDVAHASPALVDDVLELSTRPIIVSHTGVQAVCPGPRNLSDDQLRRIAAKGGVVGIGFWDGAICQPTMANAARAIVHAVQIAGEDHVSLGSDFDGSTTEPIDASGYPRLTQALLNAGMTPPQIAKVMGENAIRVLRALLPNP
jgi:microsomal dipeptidase-like Zn-dependent dipeptidase